MKPITLTKPQRRLLRAMARGIPIDVAWKTRQRQLRPLERKGLIRWTGTGYELTEAGWRVKAINPYSRDRRRASRTRRDPLGTRCPVGTRVQTLLLSRVHFPSHRRAEEWAVKHGFVASKIDAQPNFYRLRQAHPRAFRSGSLRTITLRPGVMAVVGCPK